MEDLQLAIPSNVIKYRKELEENYRLTNQFIIFADVSGFTALTERLKTGRGAAEKIATAINRVVKPITLNAINYGGNIIAIEGDAVLASFEELPNALSFCKTTLDDSRDHEKEGLSIDIGISQGTLYETIVNSNGRRIYYTDGSGINQAYKIEKKSSKNLVSDFQIGDSSKIDDYYIVDLSKFNLVKEEFFTPIEDKYSLSFLPEFARTNIQNSISHPSIMFLDICSALEDPSKFTKKIKEAFPELEKITERTKVGFIDKLKSKGTLINIGAPFTQENPAKICLEVLCQIQSEFRSRELILEGIGLNQGEVFYGKVCGRPTIMGDAVNTAARIKEISNKRNNSETLVSETIEEKVRNEAIFNKLDLEELRGKKDKVKIFIFNSFTREKTEDKYILYKDLEEKLLKNIDKRYKTKSYGEIIEIIGELGSGKDRFVNRISKSIKEQRVIETECSPIYSESPYYLITEILKAKLEIKSNEELYKILGTSNIESAIPKIKELVRKNQSIYIINKLEHADEKSLSLISRISNDIIEGNSTIIASSSSQRINGSKIENIKPLSYTEGKKFAEAIALEVHKYNTFRNEDLDRILRISKGNPLFISEIVKAAKQGKTSLELDEELPETIEEIMMIRVDKLNQDTKKKLQTLSLLSSPKDFDVRIETIETKKLQTEGFLDENNQLSNPLLRKALYNSMPPDERKEKFTEIALSIEGSQDKYLEAYYFMNANLDNENIRNKFVNCGYNYIYSLLDPATIPNEILEKVTLAASEHNNKEDRKKYGRLLLTNTVIKHAKVREEKEYEEILKISDKASKIYKGEYDEYKALMCLGRALCFTNKYEEGLKKLDEAAQNAIDQKEINYYLWISQVHANILYGRLNFPEKGLNLLLKTIENIKGELKEDNWERKIGGGISGTFEAIADCYCRVGEYESALEYADKAIYYSENLFIWNILACSFKTKGNALRKKGELKEARYEFSKALKVISYYDLEMKNEEIEILEAISKLEEKRGNREISLNYKKQIEILK